MSSNITAIGEGDGNPQDRGDGQQRPIRSIHSQVEALLADEEQASNKPRLLTAHWSQISGDNPAQLGSRVEGNVVGAFLKILAPDGQEKYQELDHDQFIQLILAYHRLLMGIEMEGAGSSNHPAGHWGRLKNRVRRVLAGHFHD